MIKNIKARLALSFYRGVSTSLRPFLMPYLRYRAAQGKEILSRRCERFGKPTAQRPTGTLIWLHAASVGETIALIPMIEYMLALNFHILLTTGTVTSAIVTQNRLGDRVIHQFHPFDMKSAMRRFLDYWRPDLALVCESEIWPMRILELARRHIPQVLLNAHLSERSYHAWKKHLNVAQYIFSKLNLAIAQSETDAQHYRDLGVRLLEVSGNLKADITSTTGSEVLMRWREAIGDRPTWAAISTHAGEESMAGEVHLALKQHIPNLLTIIVPRHPERAPEIFAALTEKNLRVVRRSGNNEVDSTIDIFLGDTIGEMDFYLNLTEVAFVGKSLAGKGGHNPLEPARLGVAILSGPNIGNFNDTYQRLIEDEAVRIVNDPTQLAVQINLLLTKPHLRAKMAENARRSVGGMSGALAKTQLALQPFLQPLIVQAQLNANRPHQNV